MGLLATSAAITRSSSGGSLAASRSASSPHGSSSHRICEAADGRRHTHTGSGGSHGSHTSPPQEAAAPGRLPPRRPSPAARGGAAGAPRGGWSRVRAGCFASGNRSASQFRLRSGITASSPSVATTRLPRSAATIAGRPRPAPSSTTSLQHRAGRGRGRGTLAAHATRANAHASRSARGAPSTAAAAAGRPVRRGASRTCPAGSTRRVPTAGGAARCAPRAP